MGSEGEKYLGGGNPGHAHRGKFFQKQIALDRISSISRVFMVEKGNIE